MKRRKYIWIASGLAAIGGSLWGGFKIVEPGLALIGLGSAVAYYILMKDTIKGGQKW